MPEDKKRQNLVKKVSRMLKEIYGGKETYVGSRKRVERKIEKHAASRGVLMSQVKKQAEAQKKQPPKKKKQEPQTTYSGLKQAGMTDKEMKRFGVKK